MYKIFTNKELFEILEVYQNGIGGNNSKKPLHPKALENILYKRQFQMFINGIDFEHERKKGYLNNNIIEQLIPNDVLLLFFDGGGVIEFDSNDIIIRLDFRKDKRGFFSSIKNDQIKNSCLRFAKGHFQFISSVEVVDTFDNEYRIIMKIDDIKIIEELKHRLTNPQFTQLYLDI